MGKGLGYFVNLGKNGRIVIPVHMREELQLNENEPIYLEVQNGVLLLMSSKKYFEESNE